MLFIVSKLNCLHVHVSYCTNGREKILLQRTAMPVFFAVTVSQTDKQRAAKLRATQPTAESNTDDDDDNFDNSTWQIDYLRLRVRGETL